MKKDLEFTSKPISLERIKMLRRNLLQSLMAVVPIHFIPKNTIGVVENWPENIHSKTRKEFKDGSWNETTYNEYQDILTYKDSTGFWYKNTYSQDGSLLSYRDNTGFWAEHTYNENEKPLSYKNSKGFWTKHIYNENGRQIRFENSEGFWTECIYDQDGKIANYKTSATV